MRSTDIEILKTLLLSFDRAMLVSRCGEGMRARPMTLAQTPESNHIWLLCGTLGEKFEELRTDSQVNVVLHDGLRFCSVSGSARVARAARDSSLQPGDRPNPTRLVLIEVTPETAEYWDRATTPGVRFDDDFDGDVVPNAERQVVGGAPRSPPSARALADESRGDAGHFDNVIFVGNTRWRR